MEMREIDLAGYFPVFTKAQNKSRAEFTWINLNAKVSIRVRMEKRKNNELVSKIIKRGIPNQNK